MLGLAGSASRLGRPNRFWKSDLPYLAFGKCAGGGGSEGGGGAPPQVSAGVLGLNTGLLIMIVLLTSSIIGPAVTIWPPPAMFWKGSLASVGCKKGLGMLFCGTMALLELAAACWLKKGLGMLFFGTMALLELAAACWLKKGLGMLFSAPWRCSS
jgi:hypothetical protein